MTGRTLIALCCLALAVQRSSAALAIKRPALDCANPAVTEINSVNYFPPNSNAQIRSITPVVSDALSTTVTIAQDFSVRYYGTYKVVTNKRVNETYVLYQCGTPNPLDFQDGVAPGVPSDAKAFQIPLVSVSAPDTTINGFLTELGVFNRIAFASAYSINSCMQALSTTCGLTAADSYSNASMLAAQSTQVDAVFTFSKSSSPNSIAFTATLDPGTLDRAEWVKFVAPFFNMEPTANQLFDSINATYNSLKDSVAAAVSTAPKPKVAWMYAINTTIAFGYPWNGKAIIFSLPAYKNQYITDAGGVPLNNVTLLNTYAPAMVPESYSPRVNTMLNVTADPAAAKTALLDILKDVDVIIDETFSASNVPTRAMLLKEYGISSTEAASIPAFANDRVYTELGVISASGTDWFERVVARPDLVLANFVAAITPSAAGVTASAATPDTRWLLPLGGTPTVLTPASCNSLKDCVRAAPTPIVPSSLVADTPTTANTTAAAPKDSSAGSVAGGAAALVAAAAAALLLL